MSPHGLRRSALSTLSRTRSSDVRDARQAGDKLEDDAERRAHSGEDPRRPGSATETLKLKVVLVGPRGVGKTSLVRRHVQNAFDDAYWSTVGTNVYKWTAILDVGGHAVRVGMAVWDTAGESHVSESLIDLYLYGVQGILAVCDVTDAGTVPALVPWVDAVRRVAGDVPVHILVNKIDLAEQAAMDEDRVRAFSEAYDSPYLFTSARRGDNVGRAFEEMARRILDPRMPPLVLAAP